MKKLAVFALACGAAAAQNAHDWAYEPGAVFAATNDVKHNEVVMYRRSETGGLRLIGSFATGGRGEGGINDPLQARVRLRSPRIISSCSS